MENASNTTEHLNKRIAEITHARNRSVSLLRERLEALKHHEDQQAKFIDSGSLSMNAPGEQKMRATLKRIIAADFLLQRKIHTRNIFLLRVRIRHMEEQLKKFEGELAISAPADEHIQEPAQLQAENDILADALRQSHGTQDSEAEVKMEAELETEVEVAS